MQNWFRNGGWLACYCAAALLAACSGPAVTPAPATEPALVPYYTATTAALPSATEPATAGPSATPAPTSTPQTYQVVRNDTLTAIAKRFGVTLEVLMAANPGVTAGALRVGQNLTIPAAGQSAPATPAATVVPLEVRAAFCGPSGTGILCYVPVRNPNGQAVENVSLRVSLMDQHGQALASQTAILPLDVLAPGGLLAASVFFKDISGPVSAQSELLGANLVQSGDPRYLQTSLHNVLASMAWDGFSAGVEGQVQLAAGGKPAASLWVAAVAYDIDGQIVGARRWDWTGSLQPGALQPFKMAVYSLGPRIQRVEVQVEARP